MIDTCGRELYDNWDLVSAYTLKVSCTLLIIAGVVGLNYSGAGH